MWGHRRTLLVAIALVGSVSACGSGDGGASGASVPPTVEPVAETDVVTPAPVETDPPVTEPVETDPPVTEPVETNPPTTDAAAPSAPVLLDSGPLAAGATYQSQAQATNVTFAIPAEHGDGGWVVGMLNPVRFVITAIPEGGTPNFDPGVAIAAVADIATVDDVVASITDYAADNESFEVIAEVGMFRGEEVTVLRGSSAGRGSELLEIPTSEVSEFFLPTGPREFVAYLLQASTQLMVVLLNAHPEDFDFLVERAAPILDSLVFE